jgi:glycosyltransferase involved in cell wall biosynthesis
MQKQGFALLFPGDPDTPTGGFLYDRMIRDALITQGHDIRALVLDGPFPETDLARNRAAIGQAMSWLSDVPKGLPLVVDGLALGGFGAAVAPLAVDRPLIGLVHHPLALETGVPDAMTDHFRMTETAALAHCAGVIVTSETTRDTLVDAFGVDPAACMAVPPGVAPFEHGHVPRQDDGPVRLLSVGTLTQRKGHGDLLAALAQLQDYDWTLDVFGDDTRDPQTTTQLRALIAAEGLGSRVTLHGAVSESALRASYAQADLFVLAAHYEGYGMAFAEAVAAGLPIIGTTGGAIPRTVPQGCGILVEPGDVAGLTEALRQMIGHPPIRRAFAETAREAAESFADWPERAQGFAQAVETFTRRWNATQGWI